MNSDVFDNKVVIAQSQLAKLRQHIKDNVVGQADAVLADELTDYLAVALEDIAVAQEELNQQSEQLESAFFMVEKERLRYQQLFAPAPVAFLLTDCNGIILQANRAAAALLNVDTLSLSRKPLVVFIPKKEQAAFFAQMERTQAEDTVCEWETQFRPRHGQTIDVLVAVSASAELDGKATIQWAFQNITDRKRAEEKISQQHRELTALNIFSTVISSSLEPPTIFAALKRLLGEQLSVPGGIILSVDTTGQSLSVETSWGLDEPMVQMVKSLSLAAADRPATSDLDGVIFAEYRREALLKNVSSQKSSPWKACLSLQFSVDGKTRHILDMFSSQGGAFEGEHAIFMETLAQQVAIALRKVALFASVRRLSRELIVAQEKERRELARELHDEIGQQLTGLKLLLETPASPPQSTEDKVRKATEAVNQLIGQVRTLSLNLRPAMLDDLGLLPSLLWYFQRYTEQSQIAVNFQHSDLDCRLDTETETAIYRIVQEALTNVARHAHVKEVTLRAWVNPNAVYLQIKDEGIGFDFRQVQAARTSSGINNMIERAALLHGRLEIDTAPGTGTSITVELPLL